MKTVLTCFFLLFVSFLSAQKKYYLLTGTYTRGKSAGVYVYDFDNSNGAAGLVDSIGLSNPSYVAVSPDQQFVYAVNEDSSNGKGGWIAALSFNNSNGHLSLINRELTLGDHPCYVAVDRTGKWVAAGNYTSGSLSLFPVLDNGSLGKVKATIAHEGHGTNRERQAGAHVHATVFSQDNKFLFVPDLGIDKVMVYTFNDRKGELEAASTPFVKLPDGSGPRHMDFHPSGKWAYLVQEMGGNVTVFDYRKGTFDAVQTVSTLPADYNALPTSADVHVSPDGKYLYASNRDPSNTIAIFRINGANGKLTLVAHQPTLGKTPRNFSIDPSGNFLLVANQNSDNTVIFRIDKETGLLSDTEQRIHVGNPVCLKWIEKK